MLEHDRWATGSRRRPPGRRAAACATGVLVGLGMLTGCAATTTSRDAADAASDFVTALSRDPSAACALLAPGTRQALEDDAGTDCSTALSDSGLPEAGRRQAATLAGHAAQVRFAGDTVFLALFDDGWKVVAAGCERNSDDPAVPYDCAVEGS
ncbi:hypothetical protein [Oryzobacter terrae]|uniref:hypothetical protein n=1 Tax=Oryzobacter terrae TaxID=1620385 RepID=UPI00366CE8E2